MERKNQTATTMKHLPITPSSSKPPVINQPSVPDSLPQAQETKVHPTNTPPTTNASLFFVGTATTIIEYSGLRILTDPNFLHAGDHVHLGPGVSATRRTNPAIDLEELPRIDVIFLSHYHEDHFDREVEDKLRRDIPIITTPHAKECLEGKGDESFTNVHALDFWEGLVIDVDGDGEEVGRKEKKKKRPAVKITGMPGKHVPPGPLNVANEILGAVPPTNGWMIELGISSTTSSSSSSSSSTSTPEEEDGFENGYRIYISGDTLLVDELKSIPERYKDHNIDLMLIHLGGTTIPGPKMPLLMVTMDAEQGVQLMQLINPDLTIPIHYDDYDVFLSPLEDFKKKVQEAGLASKVVYLDRKDEFKFSVRDGK